MFSGDFHQFVGSDCRLFKGESAMMSGNQRSLVAGHGFEGPLRAGSWPTSRNESKGEAIVTSGQGAVAVEEGVSQANAMDFCERAVAGTQQRQLTCWLRGACAGGKKKLPPGPSPVK